MACASFTVTNTGNVTISGPITVTDDIATDELCPAGDLAPGGALTCTASHTITQGDLDDGFVTNVAFATGTDTNGDPVVSPDDEETVDADQNPALSIVKTASPLTYDEVGDVIDYSYLVTNTGDVSLTNVVVNDPHSGLSAISCPATALAVGANMTCSATYDVTQADVDAGQIDNTGDVAATDPDGNPVTDDDPETVPVPQNPALSIVKDLTSNDCPEGKRKDLDYIIDLGSRGIINIEIP